MANQKELESYILKNAQVYNMQVIEIGWPHRLNIPITDISVKLLIDANWYEGRGTDRSSNLAVIKAFVEAYERYFINHKKWPSSNGAAGHYKKDLSEKHASWELLERHIFFLYFFSGRKFKTSVVTLSDTSQALLSHLESTNIKVTQAIICVGNSSAYFCLTCLFGSKSKKKPFGVIIGTAVCNSLQAASEKSLIEAFRFYSYFTNTESISPISEIEFKNKTQPSLEDHSSLGLDIDYGKWFEDTYIDPRTDVQTYEFEMSSLTVESYDLRSTPEKIPLFLSKASGGSDIINFAPQEKLVANAKTFLGGIFKNPKPHPFR